MTEEKKYYKVEELLPEGQHLLKVYPQNLWDNEKKEYIKGTLKSGTSKFGNWYIFKTKIGEEYVSIFANDENKEAFESGFIKANIVPKRMKGVEGDLFGKDGKKLLKAFYNPLTPAELELAKAEAEGNVVEGKEVDKEEEEINIDDIKF